MKIVCPVCLKSLGNVPHYAKCNPNNLSNEEVKHWVFQFNFAPFIEENGATIKALYVDEQRSVQELAQKYNLPWGKIKKILTELGITHRGLSDASNTTRTRQKYKETCIDKYGAENALSKNTEAYHKRNQTVQSKYGVQNVRQSNIVKDKINQTMMYRYGTLRITKLPRFQKNKPNKLEARVSAALTLCDIAHTFSYYIKRRQFDFHISYTKIVIEIQGDFWHANPAYYKSTDTIKFITGLTSVQSIWDADEAKIQVARSYGYTVIPLWESDINKLNDEELQSWLLNHLATELRRLLPDQQQ